MSILLKKVTSAVSVVALAFTAVAPSFVAAASGFLPYAEALATAKIITTQSSEAGYRLADNALRQEVAAIMMSLNKATYADNYTCKGVFSDISSTKPNSWICKVVETALEKGLIAKNATFRPMDNTTRAEALAMILKWQWIEIQTATTPAFSDTTGWQANVANTALDKKIISANKTFRPNDLVSRGELFVMATNAAWLEIVKADDELDLDDLFGDDTSTGSTSTGSTSTSTGSTSDTTVVATGDLQVGLSAATPAGQTLPKWANAVPLLKIDLTAGTQDASVDSISFTRQWVGDYNDWSYVYLFNGSTRLKSGKTISSDNNKATISGLGLVIKAGTTVTLTLKWDIASANVAGSEQHYFTVASKSDVAAGWAVNGSFPIIGSTFTLSSTSVSTVTIEKTGTISKPTLGQKNAKVSSFKISAWNNNVSLRSVALYNGGTMSSANMSNFVLKQNDVTVATASSIEKDLVSFETATGFSITKNQNKAFDVYADITGGKPTDNIKFYLDQTTDLNVIDEQFNVGASVTNSNFDSTNVTATSILAGKVTVTDNSPVAASIAANSTQAKLLEVAVNTQRNIEVKKYKITLTPASTTTKGNVTNGGGLTSIATTATTITWPALTAGQYYMVGAWLGIIYAETATSVKAVSSAISVTDGATPIYPVVYVKNLKLIDGKGSTLYSNNSDYYLYNNTAGGPGKDITESFSLNAGTTTNISLYVDVDTKSTSSATVQASLDLTNAQVTTADIKDIDSNSYLTIASDIVWGAVTGKAMTINTNSIAANLASTPVSTTYVKGQSLANISAFSLQAGEAGDIKVTNLVVKLDANTANPWSGVAFAGGTSKYSTAYLKQVYLYEGSTLVAGPVSISTSGTEGTDASSTAEFSNMSYTITKASTKTLTLKADLTNTYTPTGYIRASLAASSITAQDKDGNSVTNSDVANTSVTMAMGAAGTLTATVEGQPDAGVIIAGASDVLVNKFRFHATKEDIKVTKLTILNNTTGLATADTPIVSDAQDTTAITNIKLKYTTGSGSATETKVQSMSAWKATVSGMNFVVPKDGDGYLEIYVDATDMATWWNALSGKKLKLYIAEDNNSLYTEYVAQASSSTTNTIVPTNEANINAMTVRKSKPTFAKQSVSTTLRNGSDVEVFKVNVTAPSQWAVSLARLVYNISKSGNAAFTTVSLYRGSTKLTSTTITDQAGNAVTSATPATQIVVLFTQEESIGAGSTNTYTLKIDTVTGVALSWDSLTVGLNNGDETTEPNIATANNGNTNTSNLLGSTVNHGLLTAANKSVYTGNTTRNIVWSDKSSDSHAYSTTADETTGSQSTDYTNGYLLKITDLTANTLSY